MTRKIFRSILSAVVLILVLSFSVVTGVLYRNYMEIGKSQLKDELSIASAAVQMQGKDYLEQIESNRYRITWIAWDGTVIYDTKVPAAEMKNHGDREEVIEALEQGYGDGSRLSDTLTVKMIYSASRMDDGTILRISTKVDSIFAMMSDILIPLFIFFLLSILLSAFLARYMANRIIQPLNELDLEHPADNDSYEELTPVLGELNRQHKKIADQKGELLRKQDEFELVTASMKEGLILLDKQGMIVSMNPAARHVFHADKVFVGKDFLTVDRSMSMTKAVRSALKGKHTEFREEREGKVYQFVLNRIESENEITGVLILSFDITEKAYAERNRQEFTANVTHELKTPLQAILGSAELLESGLVKEEDRERFVGHIKKEASRLVDLINDIIRLSQLDEKSDFLKESVDLYELTEEVFDVLKVPASKKNVALELKGEHYSLNGVRRYLYEILYNLCDNAIRYNVEGGKVTVRIQKMRNQIKISVKDTGIGIPLEHQERVFERFYRVDKSHSKETGGTGLGLSIVKHAVSYHNGVIALDSKPGEGTSVIIVF